MKRRLLFVLALLAGAAAAATAWRPGEDASAVGIAQVVGSYKLKLKGDGWLRGSTAPYKVGRFGGAATLVLSRGTPDDGRLHVEIRLGADLNGGLLDLATPNPAFVGDARLVGDSLAVIDTGGPTYVNALTILFQKDGAKLVGHWLSAFPSTDPAGPASAVSVEITGKRIPQREFVAHGR